MPRENRIRCQRCVNAGTGSRVRRNGQEDFAEPIIHLGGAAQRDTTRDEVIAAADMVACFAVGLSVLDKVDGYCFFLQDRNGRWPASIEAKENLLVEKRETILGTGAGGGRDIAWEAWPSGERREVISRFG